MLTGVTLGISIIALVLSIISITKITGFLKAEKANRQKINVIYEEIMIMLKQIAENRKTSDTDCNEYEQIEE